MIDQEKAYMEPLIDCIRPYGDVLEIGFGLGSCATRVESYHPKSHTIIESQPLSLEQAKAWAASYQNVKIIEGAWKNAIKSLGEFDTIFLNGYSYENESINKISLPELIEARNLLQEQKDLFDEIEKQIPSLSTISYSDEDLEEFCKNASQSNSRELFVFLGELEKNRQISMQQYNYFAEKYCLEKNLFQGAFIDFWKNPEKLFLEYLKNHIKKGGSFSAFIHESASKYEDPSFFEKIISNPLFDYQEKQIPIKSLPSEKKTALAMILRKKA